MPSVSIVIPAYNEEKYIGRLLLSLSKLPQENILEIIVVDNKSIDKTKEIVKSFLNSQKNLRLVDELKQGVAWARTRATVEAKGEIIAFLDADTYVNEIWLTKLLKAFVSEKVAAISGPTYFDDIPKWQRFLVTLYWFFSAVFVASITGYMGIFANLAIRADALKKIGGIDTSVEFYGDDTNITRRLSKVGKVIFTQHFYVFASGRRFNQEGLIKTAWRYMINFFSEALVHKPFTKGYTEVR